jgi:hypothetical protein
MKYIKLYEDFVTEKAYQLSGSYGAKGIPGKVLFAFKKEVEGVKYESDAKSTLKDINDAWFKFADKDGAKIIETEVLKQVKDKEAIVYITATLSNYLFEEDSVSGSELRVRIPIDFVINIGFADDVDAGKFSRKLNGMQNDAIFSKNDTTVLGGYDPKVGENNVEIRSSMFLTIDAK